MRKPCLQTFINDVTRDGYTSLLFPHDTYMFQYRSLLYCKNLNSMAYGYFFELSLLFIVIYIVPSLFMALYKEIIWQMFILRDCKINTQTKEHKGNGKHGKNTPLFQLHILWLSYNKVYGLWGDPKPSQKSKF